MSSLTPNNHRGQVEDDDTGPAPSIIPQPVMTIVSVVLVVGLIVGSAGIVTALTDWGVNAGIPAGLAVAALLVVVWIRLSRGTRP